MITLGSPAPARTSPQEPGSARAENDPRSTVLGKDGWLAFVLGTVARCYLVLVITLVAIATLPVALGWNASVVQTGSMRPAIQPGDVVLSSPLPDDQPVPLGSVVQFTAPAVGGGEHQVVHRIVAEGETPGDWVTRGDANADQDSTALTRDKITGQGRLLVRWVGLPSLWWSTGQHLPLYSWLLATVAATWLTLWTWPADDRRRTRAPRDLGARTPGARRPVARAAAFAGLAALAAGTMALVAPEPSSAAFTATTANMRNTFKVASWSTLSLGRATSYAILAYSRITNSDSHSTVLGSIGLAPGTSVTGFNGADITGAVDRNTQGAVNALADARSLFGAITARSATAPAPTALSGTLRPGTLRSAGAVTVQGTLVLDAGGDPSAVFVVQAGALSFAPSTQVRLTNGAAADKVFFVSDSTTAVGTSASLIGVLLGQGDIALDKATTLTGRAISLQGAVGMKNASIVQPMTAGPTSAGTPAPVDTPAVTASAVPVTPAPAPGATENPDPATEIADPATPTPGPATDTADPATETAETPDPATGTPAPATETPGTPDPATEPTEPPATLVQGVSAELFTAAAAQAATSGSSLAAAEAACRAAQDAFGAAGQQGFGLMAYPDGQFKAFVLHLDDLDGARAFSESIGGGSTDGFATKAEAVAEIQPLIDATRAPLIDFTA